MKMAVIALVASGCVSQVRRPCDFDVHVRVPAVGKADAECRAPARNLTKWRDDGQSVQDSDRILGCASKKNIITPPDESVAGHEMMHAIKKNCGNPATKDAMAKPAKDGH